MSNLVENSYIRCQTWKRKRSSKKTAKRFAEFIKKAERICKNVVFQGKIPLGRYIHCTEYMTRETGEHIIEDYKQEVGLEQFNKFFAMLRRMPVVEWYEIWLNKD